MPISGLVGLVASTSFLGILCKLPYKKWGYAETTMLEWPSAGALASRGHHHGDDNHMIKAISVSPG